MDNLQTILEWLYGAGAGVVAYYLIAKVEMRWPGFSELERDVKRGAAFVMVALLACIGYGLAVALGYNPLPASPQGWLEALVEVVSAAIRVSLPAIVASQVVHARELK